AVPLGDHQFRVALDQPSPDLEKARQGILQGKNHPDDVAGMIWLYRHFSWIGYLRRAVEQWALGDRYVFELQALAAEIDQARQLGASTAEQVQAWRSRIESLNRGA